MQDKGEYCWKGCIYLLSLMAMFCGFQWNLWHMAEETRFLNFDRYVESLILGRLVQSRQAGLLSAGGLPGRGRPDEVPPGQYEDLFQDEASIAFQYDAYRDHLAFRSYSPYMSLVGGQGLVLSVLDGLLDISPVMKLGLFRGLVALLSAAVLSLVVLWFYCEFGLLASLVVLGSCLISPWLTLFGRNLWWWLGMFYVPMTAVMFYLRRNPGITGRRYWALGGVVFAGILAKCVFTGYEYITTALIMTGVPFAYYAAVGHYSGGTAIKALSAGAAGAILAVGLTAAVLCCQIAAAKGNATAGTDHIWHSLKKRTYSDSRTLPPVYAQSLQASPGQVLRVYLDGEFFDAGRWLRRAGLLPEGRSCQLRYWHLILLFLAGSGVLWARTRRGGLEAQRRRSLAMIFACWVSILAPLSWFVIFKAHSYIHTNMNCITWQMPFTIFGFALVALAIRRSRPVPQEMEHDR